MKPLSIFIAYLLPTIAYAAPPPWWSDPQTRILNPDPLVPQNNLGPLNLGQLKHTAKQAKAHFDLALPSTGGAGPQVQTLVNSFVNDPATNHSLVALGQLKAVGKPFYLRLLAIGYDTRQNLIDHGLTNWAFDYPWDPATPTDQNLMPAAIGQLKLVFSFDLSTDSDSDGLPDWCGVPGGDIDGDGLTNLQEFQLGTNLRNADTDGDGMNDAYESTHGQNPCCFTVQDTDGTHGVNLTVLTPLEAAD